MTKINKNKNKNKNIFIYIILYGLLFEIYKI